VITEDNSGNVQPDETATFGMARKLVAIFSTDVAGYSRLMGDDEEATIRTHAATHEDDNS
jgi:class 3 adenylate cyclase